MSASWIPGFRLGFVDLKYLSWEVCLRRGCEWFVKVFILEIFFIGRQLPVKKIPRGLKAIRKEVTTHTKSEMRRSGLILAFLVRDLVNY
jgi:hypothetical protein